MVKKRNKKSLVHLHLFHTHDATTCKSSFVFQSLLCFCAFFSSIPTSNGFFIEIFIPVSFRCIHLWRYIRDTELHCIGFRNLIQFCSFCKPIIIMPVEDNNYSCLQNKMATLLNVLVSNEDFPGTMYNSAFLIAYPSFLNNGKGTWAHSIRRIRHQGTKPVSSKSAICSSSYSSCKKFIPR